LQPNHEENPKNKKRQIIFAAASISAIAIVGTIAYFSLSKIRSGQSLDAMTQEQFEGAPTISSQLQSDCQQSAVKVSEMTNPEKMDAEFRANVENCKDVYFVIDHQTQFRSEGMYPDLAVDLAHFIGKSDKTKALELLKFAREMKPWEFYLGPVTCDSQHVLDAYIESFNLPDDKICYTEANYKTTLLPELQKKNFDLFSKMLANDQVVWMGMPDSDVGCPEKVSSIIKTVRNIADGNAQISAAEAVEPANANPGVLNLIVKSGGQDKATLVFTTVKDCLQINSILVPNLETSE
jgi:hypothetical protein